MKKLNQIKTQGGKNMLDNRILVNGLLLCFTTILCSTSLSLKANEWQSLEAIEKTARNFLEEKQDPADIVSAEVTISRIDARTRLAACDEPLIAFLSPGMNARGRTTVGVRCNGSRAWKIYLSARVEHRQMVWVTTRRLSKSDVITRNDITQQRVATSRFRQPPLLDLALILNTSPKRMIRNGGVIFQESVCMVCRGDTVSVSANNSFLSIDVEGTALSDATLGEKAQIRNSRSKRVFNAIVTGKNQLKVMIAEN